MFATIFRKISNRPIIWVFSFLIPLFLFSVLGIVVLKSTGKLINGSFEVEIGKTFLQIISVSVIGTLASLLLALFNSRRVELQKELDKLQSQKEKEKERENILDNTKNQIRKDILYQLNLIYSDSKKARRMLRAKALSISYDHQSFDNSKVCLVQYDHYMEEINGSQLKLESIKKEIETYKGLFTLEKGEKITKFIKRMEKSLNKVVSEYESSRSKFKGEPATLSISELSYLKDFLGPTDESNFKKDFLEINYELILCIREEIINFN